MRGNFSWREKIKESLQKVAEKMNLKNVFSTSCPKHHLPTMKFTAYISAEEINFLD